MCGNGVAEAVDRPARADELDLTIRTVRLPSADAAYIDEGTGDPIVLLHGAPMTSLGFARLVTGLRERFRVLAPDLPGFGCTVPARGFDHSLDAHARFVVEFCESLALENAILFINDSSGPIGIAAAASLIGRIDGLVIADTVPIPIVGAAAPIRFVLRRVVGSRAVRWLNRRLNLLPWLVANVAPMHRRLPRRMRRAMTDEFESASSRERVIDLFVAMAEDGSFIDRAAAAACSISRIRALILYGQFDPVRFVGGPARYRELFPESREQIIAWEEHFPLLGSADRVAAAIISWRGDMERQGGADRGSMELVARRVS